MFSPCLPLFAFGNANFPSSPPWVGWVLWHQHPLLPSGTPPCRSPGPNSAYNEVPRCNWEQSLAWQGSIHGLARGLGTNPGGCAGCWALHCAPWWPGQPLGFGMHGAGHWKLPLLASLQKWLGENSGWPRPWKISWLQQGNYWKYVNGDLSFKQKSFS